MRKILVLLFVVFLLSGCSTYSNLNETLEEGVEYAIQQETLLHNINAKGYRYYLPINFKLIDDKEYNQVFLSEGDKFYLNVDIISYHNKNIIESTDTTGVYKYMALKNKDTFGYLKIIEEDNCDCFFMEMVYNYGIIEAEIEKENLYSAVINSAYILSSISYNNAVIENLVGENILQSTESLYSIFSPKEEADPKNFLDYVEQYSSDDSKIKDSDIINN